VQIESIDSSTIKITLSHQDLSRLDITYEQMDYQDPATRKALLGLLRQAQTQTGLDLTESKLFVEAFPDENDGCILYINLVSPHPKDSGIYSKGCGFNTPLIFQMDTIEEVSGLCSRLQKGMNHLVVKSSLFSQDQAYWLLLYTYCRMEDRLIAAASEFGRYMGKGSILAAMVREHSREIIAKDAIETIAYWLE
jgi:negative regulator of genetic competence, sporulation and motility